MKKNKEILFVVVLFCMSFALAAHVITTSDGGTSFNFNETVESIYNISVNNTDTTAEGNITQVNITLPSEFSFIAGTNATDAGTHTFTNTSTILTWSGDGLVMNETEQFFWFNATAETGAYNITVTTTNSTGPAETTNLSVEINDTTNPDMPVFVTPSDNANLSVSDLVYNVTATDNGVIDTILLRLYNSSNSEINTSNSSSSPLSGNFSNLTEGTYYMNATVNDTYGNENESSTITVNLDTTNPTISDFSCTPGTVEVGETVTCSCTGADSFTGVETTSYTANPSTSTAGTFSTTCTVTDYAGNSVNSSVSYTVESTSTSSSGGGGTSTPTYTLSDSDLVSGYTKMMYERWKLGFSLEGESHLFQVEDIETMEVLFSISSEHQEMIINEGETVKIDLDEDGYYELSVKLNSIESSENTYYRGANFTLALIDERIVQDESPETSATQDEPTSTETTRSTPLTGRAVDESERQASNTFLYIFTGVVIVSLIIYFVMRYQKKGFKKKKRTSNQSDL